MDTFFAFDHPYTLAQLLLIGLIFVWTGFVRSGLGFGGAALGLPLLLLVDDRPLLWLPLIGIHLLFFSALTLRHQQRQVNWGYLKGACKVLIIPKLIGVFGLLTLPNDSVLWLVYLITLFYGICYAGNIQLRSQNRYSDLILLIIGGYVSGTSLIGAPLIVVVFARHLPKTQLRDTLFVLWTILVVLKLSLLAAAGVPFYWTQQLWLLPCAFIGHLFGNRLHQRLLQQSDHQLKRWIGLGLCAVTAIALARHF